MSKPTPKKPSPYDKLSEKNKIVFLAGVFEGEGSFGIWSKWKTRGYTRNY